MPRRYDYDFNFMAENFFAFKFYSNKFVQCLCFIFSTYHFEIHSVIIFNFGLTLGEHHRWKLHRNTQKPQRKCHWWYHRRSCSGREGHCEEWYNCWRDGLGHRSRERRRGSITVKEKQKRVKKKAMKIFTFEHNHELYIVFICNIME